MNVGNQSQKDEEDNFFKMVEKIINSICLVLQVIFFLLGIRQVILMNEEVFWFYDDKW